ncbi:hypothetical protein [Sphingobacterium spiritivorum]|uniref:hypothetical protein n=1 Tax=Sphingobacterium spiritivorum TaxID=258 RepID=UPI003DA56844
MASGAIINTIGRDLERWRKDKVKRVRDLVQDSITKVEILATRSAPNFISIDKKFTKGGFVGEVGVMGSNDMAAYIEFGTGLSARSILANYPRWVQDIAMKFYVNGQGTLQGKPYLYNNFLVVQAEFERQLQIIMNS